MKIINMKKGSWTKIVAFFDVVTSDGFTIKGFKLVDSGNAKFVGFPSQKGKDGEFYPTVWADKELKEQLNKLALEEYDGGVQDMSFDDIPGAFEEKKSTTGTQEDVPF